MRGGRDLAKERSVVCVRFKRRSTERAWSRGLSERFCWGLGTIIRLEKERRDILKKLKRMARELIGRPKVLDRLLPRLLSEKGSEVLGFGYELGREDQASQLWSKLVNGFTIAGDAKKTELLTGYLVATFKRSRAEWEEKAFGILSNSLLKDYFWIACSFIGDDAGHFGYAL